MKSSILDSRPPSKVVVITGASAGVGRATVREFARRHYRIGLLARGRDGLEAARREVEAMGGQALAISCDVADAEAVEAAAERIERTLGPIETWINVAMVSVFAPVKEVTAAEFRRVTEVTYLGYVHGTLAALRRMLPRDRGTIVQVGSALAYRAIPLQAAYCASKHAVKGFTESLRTELLHDRCNVNVTMVNLPAVNTPQFSWSRSRLPREPQPVPPIFQPEVPARAIYHASRHPRRKQYDVALPTLKAVVGEKLAPGLADRYLARAGYQAQLTDKPTSPDRLDNLDTPVPGDHGAHGSFDDRARPYSVEAFLSRHRLLSVLAMGALAGAAATLLRGRRGRRRTAGAGPDFATTAEDQAKSVGRDEELLKPA